MIQSLFMWWIKVARWCGRWCRSYKSSGEAQAEISSKIRNSKKQIRRLRGAAYGKKPKVEIRNLIGSSFKTRRGFLLAIKQFNLNQRSISGAG